MPGLENGTQVVATTNVRKLIQPPAGTNTLKSGKSFDAPSQKTDDKVTAGICMGISLRWLKKALKGLHRDAMFEPVNPAEPMNESTKKFDASIRKNNYEKAAKVQGIFEALPSSEHELEDLCELYGMRVLPPIIRDEAFDQTFKDFLRSKAFTASSAQGCFCLTGTYQHAMAFRLGHNMMKSYYLDPNHGLYEFDDQALMITSIKEHLAAKYSGHYGFKIARVELAS